MWETVLKKGWTEKRNRIQDEMADVFHPKMHVLKMKNQYHCTTIEKILGNCVSHYDLSFLVGPSVSLGFFFFFSPTRLLFI